MPAEPMTCPKCGIQMNHHADKLDSTSTAALAEPDAVNLELGGILNEVHTCPSCKTIEIRRAT